MCVTPNNIDGQLVACHGCWQCSANRIHDYSGRALAEAIHSDLTLIVTLTYGGGDTPESTVLNYKHVQNFIKNFRNKGYKVRYAVSGELGSFYGRCHWHIACFFSGKMPKGLVYNKECYTWDYWEHGYSFIEKPTYHGFNYMFKYMLKQQKHDEKKLKAQEIKQNHFAISKKPPLGDEYFKKLAIKHVEQGISPQTFIYSFNDEFDKHGKRREFYIQGKTRKNYIKYYLHEWLDRHAFSYKKMPYSQIVEDYEDELVKHDPVNLWQKLLHTLENKDPRWDAHKIVNHDEDAIIIKTIADEWNAIWLIPEKEENREKTLTY